MNNLVGKKICEFNIFDQYCQEFDNKNNFAKNTSKGQIFYNNSGNDNILGYVLEKGGYNYSMHHYDFYRNKTINIHENTIGFILYTTSHAFCIRRYEDKFYLIDSAKPQPIVMDPVQFCKRPMLGVIEIRGDSY